MSVWAKSWAYEQTTGSHGRKAVLVALAEFADYEGVCVPGQKRLSMMTELEERTVRRHLAQLEADGFIQRNPRRRADGTRTSDETRLLAPPECLAPPERQLPAKNDRSTGQKRQINRPKTTDQPAKMSGHIVREPSEEPSEEPSVVEGDDSDTTTTTCLEILSRVRGFPDDQVENALKVTEYRKEFPEADPLEVCRDFKARSDETGKPPTRARLRNFFKQAAKGSGVPAALAPPSNASAVPVAEGADGKSREDYSWFFGDDDSQKDG